MSQSPIKVSEKKAISKFSELVNLKTQLPIEAGDDIMPRLLEAAEATILILKGNNLNKEMKDIYVDMWEIIQAFTYFKYNEYGDLKSSRKFLRYWGNILENNLLHLFDSPEEELYKYALTCFKIGLETSNKQLLKKALLILNNSSFKSEINIIRLNSLSVLLASALSKIKDQYKYYDRLLRCNLDRLPSDVLPKIAESAILCSDHKNAILFLERLLGETVEEKSRFIYQYFLAFEYNASGEYEKARKLAKIVLPMFARRQLSPKAINNQLYLMFLMEDNKKAIQKTTRLCRKYPKSASYQRIAGWFYIRMGKYSIAEKYYSRANDLVDHPDPTIIDIPLFQLLLLNGKVEEAEHILNQIMKKSKVLHINMFLQGYFYYYVEKWDKAIINLKKSLRTPYNYPLSGAFGPSPEKESSLVFFDSIKSAALLLLGEIAFSTGDFQHSQSSFFQVITLMPHNPHSLKRLSTIYQGIGFYDIAEVFDIKYKYAKGHSLSHSMGIIVSPEIKDQVLRISIESKINLPHILPSNFRSFDREISAATTLVIERFGVHQNFVTLLSAGRELSRGRLSDKPFAFLVLLCLERKSSAKARWILRHEEVSDSSKMRLYKWFNSRIECTWFSDHYYKGDMKYAVNKEVDNLISLETTTKKGKQTSCYTLHKNIQGENIKMLHR